MIGGVTRHMYSHLPGVPHLHVNWQALRVSSDMMGHTSAGSNLGQARNNYYLFFIVSRSNTPT